MLARVLAMDGPVSVCVCVSVGLCLSLTSRCSIETDEQIELVFGTGPSFDLSHTL